MAILTNNGITPRRKADIVAEFSRKIKAEFGEDFDTSSDSDLMKSLDSIFDELDSLYQLGEQLADSFDERSASGFALESIARITGTYRDAGARSVGQITITGDALVTIPAGYLVAHNVTGALFRTNAAAVLPDTGAGSGAETVVVAVESVEIGAIPAASGTLTEPVTSISGVSSVTNAAAVAVGSARQTDGQLRVARRNELQSSGTGTPGAIYAAVSAVENVQAVVVINNTTETTDSNGVPPLSMRVVVWPVLASTEDKIAVATAIATQETGGAAFDGDQTFDITKADGQITQISYSFASQVDTRYKVNIVTKAGYPSDGNDLVKDQILKFFGLVEVEPGESIQRWQVGQDVELQQMLCNILMSVPGIQSLTLNGDFESINPPLKTTIIPIGSTEIAVISDANQVEVVSS